MGIKIPLLERPDSPPRPAWHAAPIPTIADYWTSNPETGLTQTSAAARLTKIGPNQLPEEPSHPWWKRLYEQLTDFTVLALVGAATITTILGLLESAAQLSFLERFGDSIAIASIVAINAILGVVQEQRAEQALKGLRSLATPVAKIIRSGMIGEIATADLVPGDLVLVEEGDLVPGDIRLLQGYDLQVEESSLTGESLPVEKQAAHELEIHTPLAERSNMLYFGTRVTRGRGRGLVTNTASYTELGRIAGMLSNLEREETPLEQDLAQFGKRVVIGCVAISALVFLVGLLFHSGTPKELFLVAVALAVAAIPEGLPAVTTIVLAIGTQKMARRRAIVRRLTAIETLGCTQIICTDKTGTLTKNMMTADRIAFAHREYQIGGESPMLTLSPQHSITEHPDLRRAYEIASHASGAHLRVEPTGGYSITGDPTDGALLILARTQLTQSAYQTRTEQPFTSDRRMASELVHEGQTWRIFARGAPEAIITAATHFMDGTVRRPLDDETRAQLLAKAAEWARASLRVLGLAERDADHDLAKEKWETELTFVAFVGLSDPPRPEVAEAIELARRAGVATVMITGDHPVTGRSIAEKIGLWQTHDLLVTGQELDSWDDQYLNDKLDSLRVIARATAEHKLRIVSALKRRNLICAMTGDGVNDAPAVKAASIGVAMGKTGTEVTKEAASLVLADDNFATLVAAIEEGRAIYANIKKFIFFLLSSNAGAVLFVLACSLTGQATPLAPIQILWINLITNGLPALALGVDPREPDQMKKPPRQPGVSILDRGQYLHMLWIGALMAAATFWLYTRSNDHGGTHYQQTLAFCVLSVSPLLHSFNCRSDTKSIFALGIFGNRALWGAVVAGLFLQAVTLYVPFLRPVFKTEPLTMPDVGWVFAVSAIPLVWTELAKLIRATRSKAA